MSEVEDRKRYWNAGEWKKIDLVTASAEELFYVQAAQEHSHAISFRIWTIGGMVSSGDGSPVSEPDFEGSIKWDGCSNWNACALHFCEPEEFKIFADVLTFCWEFARNNLAVFDA